MAAKRKGKVGQEPLPEHKTMENIFMDNGVTLDISEARKQLTRLDERLRDEHVIWVTRHNKRAFAVVDYQLMQTIIETLEILRDPDASKMLQESLEDIKAGRLIDHEELKREML